MISSLAVACLFVWFGCGVLGFCCYCWGVLFYFLAEQIATGRSIILITHRIFSAADGVPNVLSPKGRPVTVC